MNVILVSIDSLRADGLSCYGSSWVRTPNLDKLAKEGTLFENTIIQTPHTVPSHASLLTGLYPFNHGLRKDTGLRISPKAGTLFDLLKASDYKTAAFQGNYVLGKEYGYAGWNSKGPPNPDAIKDCVECLADSRFFIFIHTYDLHVPYCTVVPPSSPEDEIINSLLMHERVTGRRLPPSIRAKHIPNGGEDWLRRISAVVDILVSGGDRGLESVRSGYAQAIEQIDQWFGQLVSVLKRLGVWEDTMIVVTSDHGDCFNEHGEMNRNHHWSSIHGAFLYDNVLRVPLIVRLPGKKVRPARVSVPVESIDIAPTICEILDVRSGLGDREYLKPDGISLLRVMNGESKTYTYSETLIREHHKVCLRSSRTKLIVDFVSGERQLFDLVTDPAESNDLRNKQPLLAAEMESELERFITINRRESTETLMTADETAVVAERLHGLGYID